MEALTVFFFLSLMLYVSTQCDDGDNQTNKATRVFAGPVFSAVSITLLCLLLILTLTIILLEVFGYEILTQALSNMSSTKATKRKVLRTLSQGSKSTTLSSPRNSMSSPTSDILSPGHRSNCGDAVHPVMDNEQLTSGAGRSVVRYSSTSGAYLVGGSDGAADSRDDICLNFQAKEEKDAYET